MTLVIHFPGYFPKSKVEKPIPIHFVELLCDKNNLKFKTSKTNSSFPNTYPPSTNILCAWCRHSFTTPPIGVPIKNIGTSYWMEGCFCSFECCLAFLEDHFEKQECRRDPLYSKSIVLLNQLYSQFSDKDLQPAQDWRLLEHVGTGNLGIDQFRTNFFQFFRTCNVNLISSQVYYQVNHPSKK